MFKAEDSQLSGCGFEPQYTVRRILDGVSKASYYIGKKEIKVAKWGTPKKIFKKKTLTVAVAILFLMMSKQFQMQSVFFQMDNNFLN